MKTEKLGGLLVTGSGRFRHNYISQGALRRAQHFRGNAPAYPDVARHHGLLEPLQEKDERGENVVAGAAGESSEAAFRVWVKGSGVRRPPSVRTGGWSCFLGG